VVEKYYLDACIWIDFHAGRIGTCGRPLGKYAGKLFMHIVKNRHLLLFSNITTNEMRTEMSQKEVEDIMTVAESIVPLQKASFTTEDCEEAAEIARKRKVPLNDALNAIIARKNKAIMVSQDKHYLRLKDIAEVKKPEEII
jgi:predicted nucleic acid-binding protein